MITKILIMTFYYLGAISLWFGNKLDNNKVESDNLRDKITMKFYNGYQYFMGKSSELDKNDWYWKRATKGKRFK